MVKLDKIYTKGGDSGYTSIVGGKRVKKSSNIIEAISNVDELNATLGLITNYSKSNQKKIITEEIFNSYLSTKINNFLFL